MKKQLISLSMILPIPFLMFFIYAILRLQSFEPEMETGMSEFMSTFFFWSGATVCYFMMGIYGTFRVKTEYLKWLAASCLFVLLALDETYMFHEQLSSPTIKENYIFAVYGVFLLGILFLFRDASTQFWIAFFGFVLFVGTSQTADTLLGEGVITIAGKEIDYEQIFEAAGALCLALAFSFQAFNVLIKSGFTIEPQPPGSAPSLQAPL